MPQFSSPIRVASFAGAFFFAGCDASTSALVRPANSTDSAANLMAYTGPMRVLFDDGIDPDVFAPAMEATISTSDRRISERLRGSVFVVNAQIVTVTTERSDEDGRVELELQPTEPPIHGRLAPYAAVGEPFKVYLGRTSSGYSLLKSSQNDVVGKRLNLCWARFAEGNLPVEHWHALADTPKTKLAIAKAAAIVNFE